MIWRCREGHYLVWPTAADDRRLTAPRFLRCSYREPYLYATCAELMSPCSAAEEAAYLLAGGPTW